LTVDLTNPDFYDGDRLVLPRDTIHLHRMKFLWQAAYYEQVAVRNYDDRHRRVTLGILFGADFSDLFEVRGHRRRRRGSSSVERVSDTSVGIRYVGLDRVPRDMTIRFDPQPTRLDASSA